MVPVVIGIIVGVVFGAVLLGYKGWIIGAFVGGLTSFVMQQMNRISSLERLIQNLTDKQLALGKQVEKLQNSLAASTSKVEETPPVKVTEAKAESVATQPAAAKKETSTVAASKSLDIGESVLSETTTPRPIPVVKPQPTRTQPTKPREPALGDKISAAIHRFFTEGNIIVRGGMVVMFIGVSFLVKYASSQGLLPIEFRLTGVLLGAIALLVVGWKTRMRPAGYGLVLQGGGIAIIYLTLFAAAKIYGLIPLTAAFFLLSAVVFFGVVLALLQNAQVLAILATAGGFLAPILTSSGEGSHVALFSFYLILNLGILAVAVYKAWRLLNWVGFMFTFVITAAWGVLKYEPILYASTQPFLIAFFALYLTVAILFSFKQPTNLKGMVDGSLVFGLPLVAFGLQTALLKHTEYGLAISAIILAAIYLLLSAGLGRRHLQTHRVLVQSFLALGIAFATLAIPLALDASWTSVTWALEASGLVWVGLRQNRLRPRFVGYLLHVAAAISLVVVDGLDTGITPIISGDFLALALLSLTSFVIAYLLYYFRNELRSIEKIIAIAAIVFGILWWFVAGISEIEAHVLHLHQFAAIVLFTALSALVLMLVSQKISWLELGNSVFALLPFMILFSAGTFADSADTHPVYGFGLLSLAVFFAVQYRFLFIKENSTGNLQKNALLSAWHILTAWLLFAFIFWEVWWQKENLGLHGTAGLMIWFVAIILPVLILMGAGQKKFWPFISFESDYKNWVPAPLFLLTLIWFFAVCHRTIAAGHAYLPILNPLDLAQFAIILIFAYAAKREFMNLVSFISGRVLAGLLGLMLFVWINTVTLRAISHYQYISYDFDSLWNAGQVQMALSILWAICALGVMNLSRRLQMRELWLIGGGLLALVVLKLIFKDLTNSGTLERIVSFMVVGGLMLLIGYLSPIPSKSKAQQSEEPHQNE